MALSIAPLEALRGFGSAHITTNIQPIAVTTGRKCIAKRKLAKEAELAIFKAQTSPKYTPLEITVMAIETAVRKRKHITPKPTFAKVATRPMAGFVFLNFEA